MEQMYQQYKDVAEFYVVYIREAHAADSSWPVHYAKDKGIREHQSYSERCTIAKSLIQDKKLTMPFLIDGMDNQANDAYSAWPDRVFLVRQDGKLAVAARPGPYGFAPALMEAEDWLAEYKETKTEPALPTAKPDKTDDDKKDESRQKTEREKQKTEPGQ